MINFSKLQESCFIGLKDIKTVHGLIHVRYYDKKLLSEIKKMIQSYSLEFC